MKVKFRPDLMEEYAESRLWKHDIPVHQPNYYCSRCAERLLAFDSLKLIVLQVDNMPLEFEYHEACVINRLIQRLDAMKQGLLIYKEKHVKMPFQPF